MQNFGELIINRFVNLKEEHIALSKKTEAGLKMAYRRLYEQRAAKNETVIISVNGEIKRVPAKDLLKNFDKE